MRGRRPSAATTIRSMILFGEALSRPSGDEPPGRRRSDRDGGRAGRAAEGRPPGRAPDSFPAAVPGRKRPQAETMARPEPDRRGRGFGRFDPAVVEQRAVKGPEEIAELDRAADISTDMHVAAMRMVRPGVAEAEIAAEVHRVALAAGGDISFPIIASVRGETLHNHDHGNRLKRGDLFLLDAGAETVFITPGICPAPSRPPGRSPAASARSTTSPWPPMKRPPERFVRASTTRCPPLGARPSPGVSRRRA